MATWNQLGQPTMPRIIYRYLLLEILPPFGVGLLAFTCIVFLGRLMRVTQMIVVKGVGLTEVLKSVAYLLPYLLVFTLPMAATVGILLAMMRLSVDHEMIALKTAGLSYRQLLPPILVFALAAALGTLWLTAALSPWGQRATREMLVDFVKKRADLGIKEQVFNTDFPGVMLFVNHLGRGGQLEGVFIYDSRDEENPHTVYAQRGELSFDQGQETLALQLFEGRIVRWGQELSRWQAVEFKTYQLPLQLFGLGLQGAKSEVEMSLGELWEALGESPLKPERYNRVAVELSQRFALPFGALLLCLMAMPLGLSHPHHGRTWGLLLGLLIFLVYYIIFTASWRLAVNARLNPALAPWAANFVFTWVAAYLWRRTIKEKPLLLTPNLTRVWPPRWLTRLH